MHSKKLPVNLEMHDAHFDECPDLLYIIIYTMSEFLLYIIIYAMSEFLGIVKVYLAVTRCSMD